MPRLPCAWACLVFHRYNFIYVYGTTGEVFQLVEGSRWETFLPKGGCETLLEARTKAEAAAQSLHSIYADIGSARAVEIRDFVGERVPRHHW